MQPSDERPASVTDGDGPGRPTLRGVQPSDERPASVTTPSRRPLPAVGLVIFDNDGVLVDSEAISSRTLAEVLTEFGVPTTPDESRRDFTGGTLGLIRTLVEARTGRPLPERFEAVYAARLADRFARGLRPHRGVPELLDFLDTLGIATCVASNGTRARTETALRATGLLGRFDGRIFSADGVDRPKPAPDLFLHASTVLGVPADRCLVIEDSPTGIAAGRAAGMYVWAPAGTYPPDRLTDADRVSPSMERLAEELRAELGGAEPGSAG